MDALIQSWGKNPSIKLLQDKDPLYDPAPLTTSASGEKVLVEQHILTNFTLTCILLYVSLTRDTR